MESSIRGERVLNHENSPPKGKPSGRRRSLIHERLRSSKVAAFNRSRGILNVRRVLDGVVNVENEKPFKRGSSLQEGKMCTPATSRQEVVQRSETSPILRVPFLPSFHNSQDAAMKSRDDNQRIVRKPFSGERNKENENLKSCSKEKEKADPSLATEPANLNLDVEKKQNGDASETNSPATTSPLMNVLLEVSRPTSRASWRSPSSIEFSRASGRTPSSDVEDKPTTQPKDVTFDVPTPLVPPKGRLCEKITPSRVLHGSKSYDVSRERPFEDLITKEKKRKLAEYYSNPRFNVLGGRISCERSLRNQLFSNKYNTEAIGTPVKQEGQKNKNVSVRSRNTKHKSRNLVRRLLCCSRKHTSSCSSTNSDFSVKLSRSQILKKSAVGTNTSRSCLTHRATQTLLAHSGKLFPQHEKQDVKKAYYIPKCDQSTATEKETVEFQEKGGEGVIPVLVKCSTTLSLKNKVDGQTRTIKFSDNEIIIEVSGKDNDVDRKVEQLVGEPSREYEGSSLPQYLEIYSTPSTKDIHIKTSKMDIPYVASIPAWIWKETSMKFSKNKKDTTFKKINDRKEITKDSSTKPSSPAVPVIVAEEEPFQSNEQVEPQYAETANINPNMLLSCYMVDVMNDPSSSQNHTKGNEGAVNEINQLKANERIDAGTQTTGKLPEGISVFCQTAECPQRIAVNDDPERELLYVDYEGQRPADKSVNNPQRISESESLMVLINMSNDPDTSVPPVIVNLSHATTSAFKAAAFEHEIEQMKSLQRTASQLSSRQKTDADGPLRTIKLNETDPYRRSVSDSPSKEKTADDRRKKSQRENGESMIGREGRSAKLEVERNVKETDDLQEEALPQIISTSRPFLSLGDSEQLQSSVDATPEVSRKIEKTQNSIRVGARKSTTPRENSENTTEKSRGSNNTPLPQEKQSQHFETERNSLSREETESGRKSAPENLKIARKRHALDTREENTSSQFENADFLSRRATPLQREKISDGHKSKSPLPHPQRMSTIENTKKESAAFKSSEFAKEVKKMENTNFQTMQSISQSSFIKPSNTSIVYVLNDAKLFQGRGKRDRFAARAGGRGPPQRGRGARGFGPSASLPPARDDYGPGPKKGKGPTKEPLILGSPSGSVAEPRNVKPKKGVAPQRAAAVDRSPKTKEEEPQQTPKRKKSRKSSDEESDERAEITPFPVSMLSPHSTSSSVASSVGGSISESTKSLTSPMEGGTDTSKSPVVSDLESSDAESSDAGPERGSKSSRRSRRSSSRTSEMRKSVRDSDGIPETIRSTIDEGAAPPQEEQDVPSTRDSETRSSVRGSKYLPAVDEALPTKPDTRSSIASEQRRSLRGSSVVPDTVADSSKKSSVEEGSREPTPRSSKRDSEVLRNSVVASTDDARKSSKEPDRSSSRMSGPRSAEGSRSLRGSEPRSAGGSTSSGAPKQRVSGSAPDALPGKLSSASDDARKSSKMRESIPSPRVSERDSRVLPDRSKSTGEEANRSSKSRDSARSSKQGSLIRRSDFFPDPALPTILDGSKSTSEDVYPGKPERAPSSARSTSGERDLLEDARGASRGRSRESSTHSSKKSLYDTRLPSVAQDDEEEAEFVRLHSIGVAKSLERKYTLPDSDESSEEGFQEAVDSKSRDLVTDVPDSSAIEPSFIDSDQPTTATETIPSRPGSTYLAPVEDLEDERKEREAQAMAVRPPATRLPTPREEAHVADARADTRVPPCYVDARRIAREETRHVHKDSCHPVPRTEKSALNNMCEIFCNIFPCCRKLSVCCKRKSESARKTAPPHHAKQRGRKTSKASITSSQLCGKCEKCESSILSLQGATAIRQPDRPGQREITVGYNVTNLYGVYMLALEQSNSESVRVQNFSENMFSSQINPRVNDNSSSSCIFSDMKITSKCKDSKICSSGLSSNLSSKTFYDFKHISHFTSEEEPALNDALCMEDGSEDSEKTMFTSATRITLNSSTTAPSGSNDFSLQCHEQDVNSPPTTSCLLDLFSSTSKNLVLSEFYSKNYRKEKSLITQVEKKFQNKLSSQVIDVNIQSMKQQDVKKGNIFEEYTTNSGSDFTNNRNPENTTAHSLSKKRSNNYQHLVEKNCDIGLDVTPTKDELYEGLPEGKVRKRRKQIVNYEPYYVNKERLKRKRNEFVCRLEKRCETPSEPIIDEADTKNDTNDLKINLKNLYKNICKKSKNEMQNLKTKKVKEEMFKIHI